MYPTNESWNGSTSDGESSWDPQDEFDDVEDDDEDYEEGDWDDGSYGQSAAERNR